MTDYNFEPDTADAITKNTTETTHESTPADFELVVEPYSEPSHDDPPLKEKSALAAARGYRRQGWVPIPIAPRAKHPTRRDWPSSTLQTALSDFAPESNVGVLLGEPSGGLVDIDIDSPEALLAAPFFLPDTQLKFGHGRKADSHWVYILPESGDSKRYQFNGETLVEYRANGAQTVFPPSTHESGEAISFSAYGEPGHSTRGELIRAVGRLAACSLLARNWRSGTRHDTVMALAGWLLREGWAEDQTKSFIGAICALAKDDQLPTHERTVETTAEKLQIGKPTTGEPSLRQLIGKNAVGQLSEWLSLGDEERFRSLTAPASQEDDVRFTEIGNADRFIEQCGNDARYCAEMKRWLLWSNGRWNEDLTDHVKILGEKTVRSLFEELGSSNDRVERDRLFKHANRSCTAGGIEHMLQIAQAKLPVESATLDQEHWLLNCPNGVVDLRNGELRPHERGLWLTKQTMVPYIADAGCSRFEEFLREITNDDAALIAFLQRAFGYSLTGNTDEQCFFIAWGEGANGKSTLLGTLRHILGDYAQNMAVESIIQRKRDGSASPDIIRLRGARYVTAGEAEANQKMAESLVKQLTGGDAITARALYQAPIDFVPTFKLSEMDEVGQFLAECTTRARKAATPKSEMFAAYREWARENGMEDLSMGIFGSRLKAHGLDEGKKNSQRYWKGVQLLDQELEAEHASVHFRYEAQPDA